MLHAVVMAGGSGTRFWPKSRRNRPKQLLRLFGDATMLQQTVARVAPLVPAERTLIITGADQAEASREQLPQLAAGNVVAEPCPRDTAPASAWRRWIVARNDPDGTMIVMPADHVIEPPEKFLATVRAAVSVIEADPTAFVTFGIKPTRPETGYGYIERGEELPATRDGIALHRVAQFREKPDRATAEPFLASGGSSGTRASSSGRPARSSTPWRTHRPVLAAALDRVGEALGTPARGRGDRPRIPRDGKGADRQGRDGEGDERPRPRSRLRLERRRRLARPDRPGPPRRARQHRPGSGPGGRDDRYSIIVSDDGGLIATLGVEDLVIVQSGGATLVARRDQLDKLKALVEGLDKAGYGATL